MHRRRPCPSCFSARQAPPTRSLSALPGPTWALWSLGYCKGRLSWQPFSCRCCTMFHTRATLGGGRRLGLNVGHSWADPGPGWQASLDPLKAVKSMVMKQTSASVLFDWWKSIREFSTNFLLPVVQNQSKNDDRRQSTYGMISARVRIHGGRSHMRTNGT